jgi:hypothetical protein
MLTTSEQYVDHYTTKLPKIMDLDRAWKIGLAEIQYTHSWHSVMNNEAWLKVHFYKGSELQKLNPNMDCIKGLMMTLQSFFTFISIL